jgi:hypothetical protein
MARRSDVPRPWSCVEVICLGLILLIAAALRFSWLDWHSLWFDEVIMMRLAQAPSFSALAELLPRIDAIGAPLYPMILRGWCALFGTSDLAARTLSAWLSLASVGAACWVGTLASGRRVGLWCSWLVAVCPLEIQYAQEVKMYSLLGLETCLCWGTLFAFRRSAPWWRQVLFAAGLIALVYTHSLGGLMVVALAVGYALDRPRSRLSLSSWLLIHLALAAAIAPWMGRYVDHTPDAKRAPGGWSGYLTWPRLFTGGGASAVAVCWLVIVAGVFTRRSIVGDSGDPPAGQSGGPGRQQLRLDDARTALMLLAWLLVPPVLLIVYSRVRHPIFGPARYLLFTGPAYLLLLARSLAKLDVRLAGVMATAGLLLAGPTINDRVYATVGKSDWRGTARVIHRLDPTAPLLLCCDEPHIYYDTIPYYLGTGIPIVPARRHLETVRDDGDRRFPKCWIVEDELDGIRPSPELLNRCYSAIGSWRLGRLRLTYRSRQSAESQRTSGTRQQMENAVNARLDPGDLLQR